MRPYFSKAISSALSLLFFGHINVALSRGLCRDVLSIWNTLASEFYRTGCFMSLMSQLKCHLTEAFLASISRCCLYFIFFKAYHYLSLLFITFSSLYLPIFCIPLLTCELHENTNVFFHLVYPWALFSACWLRCRLWDQIYQVWLLPVITALWFHASCFIGVAQFSHVKMETVLASAQTVFVGDRG